MAEVLIRPTEPDDAATLFANLRSADLAECQAYGHADLARLSAALALPVAALFLGTAWFVWPLQGLPH